MTGEETEIHGMIHKRLDGFEQKIDKLVDAIVAIAKVEERQTAQLASMNSLNKRVDRHDDEIEVLKRISGINESKVSSGEHVFWALFTASLAIGGSILVRYLMT